MGHACLESAAGDVVIFDFGGNDHHVTLFVKDNGNGLWSCHGGNQGHQVTVSSFHKSNMMGIRRPIQAVQPGDVPIVPSIPAAPVASASQRFNACVKLVLQDEGGDDSDPRDPGGRTSRGITQSDWNDWLRTHPSLPSDVFQAPQDQIVAIYHENYWNKLSCYNLPAGVDYVVFDYGVLSGIGRSAKVLQGFVGAAVDGEIGPETIGATANADLPTLINQISDERIALMKQSPVWSVFGRGWTARVERVRAASLAMTSAAAQPRPAAPKPAPAPVPAPTPASTPTAPLPMPAPIPAPSQMTPDQVVQINYGHPRGPRRTAGKPARFQCPGGHESPPDPGRVARSTKAGWRHAATGAEPGCHSIPARDPRKGDTTGRTNHCCAYTDWRGTNTCGSGSDNNRAAGRSSGADPNSGDDGRLRPVRPEQAQRANRCCGSRNSLAHAGIRRARPAIQQPVWTCTG